MCGSIAPGGIGLRPTLIWSPAGRLRDRRRRPRSQPALSDSGLVAVRRDGNRRMYRWQREGLRDAVAFLDEMWSEGLARLKVAAEREEWPERTRAQRTTRRQQPKGTQK